MLARWRTLVRWWMLGSRGVSRPMLPVQKRLFSWLKGNLQVVQCRQRAPGIPTRQNGCFEVYRKPASCMDVVTSPRTSSGTAPLKPCIFFSPNFPHVPNVARVRRVAVTILIPVRPIPGFASHPSCLHPPLGIGWAKTSPGQDRGWD